MIETIRRPIADIHIGSRHRKDLGDLVALAKSIDTEGLLQPIGIFPDGELVFGQRRLFACRDHLGWTEIDARIVNVSSIAAGEMHENEMRKAFTPSERAAIFKTLQNQPLSRCPPGDTYQKTKHWKQNNSAKLAGFNSKTTAYRAVKVVDAGISELVDAMNNGEVTIKTASAIATQPAEQQKQHLAAARNKSPRQAKSKPAPAPQPPSRKLGHVLMARAARAAAIPELTLEEKGYPAPELATQQHPDYPPGTTYAMAWREENGRVQLWPLAEKQKMQLTHRFQEAIRQLAKLQPIDWPSVDEIDTLNSHQRDLILFSLRKVLPPLMPWLRQCETLIEETIPACNL